MTQASYFKVKTNRPFPKTLATFFFLGGKKKPPRERNQLNTVNQPRITEAERSRKESTRLDGAYTLQIFNKKRPTKPEKLPSFQRVRPVSRKPLNMTKSYCYLSDNYSQLVTQPPSDQILSFNNNGFQSYFKLKSHGES